MARQTRILFLADDRRGHTGNLLAHISAYRRYSRHRITIFNPRDAPTSRFLTLDGFDAVVIHYSLVVIADSYVAPALRDRIAAFDGLKLQFLQDEYRWVDAITTCMRALGIDVLFSIAPKREFDKLYGERLPDTLVVPTLAGFVPESLVGRRSPPLGSRAIDIGYRGRMLPYWLGALSQEKAFIGAGVLARAEEAGLRCDISSSENRRVYGRQWESFLCSCRAMLGTESGASITDFDGSIERAVSTYLRDHPIATFAEVSNAVLAPHEGNVMINVPSPRIFESAAFRTAMVLFPGEYGGVVRPGEHYISLEKDFSNLSEVIDMIKNTDALEKMTERAYVDVIASGQYSLKSEVSTFDSLVDDLATTHGRTPTRQFRLAQFERPFTTGVVAGFDLREPIRAAVMSVTATRVVLRSPPLRSLALAYASSRPLRRTIPLTQLGNDLLRLGVVLRAHQGRPATLEDFAISMRVDEPNGRVLLVSTKNSTPKGRSISRNVLAPDNVVRTLLWDNRAVGPGVHLPVLGRSVGLRVGYHGDVGLYHFSALETIAELHPERILAALDTFSKPSRKTRRRRAFARIALVILPARISRPLLRRRRHHRARRRPPIPLALLRAPRNYAAKGLLTVRVIAGDSALRRVAITGLRDPAVRASGGWVGLLEDITKLAVLHRAIAGRVSQIASVRITQDDCGLTFITDGHEVSVSSMSNQIDRRHTPNRVVWDNRPVGRVLPIPTLLHRQLFISFEPTGMHEFRALAALFASSPQVVWDALEPKAT